jgi:hypothetical protein
MRFKFYKSLQEFATENPKYFIVPALKRNPHFYDIDCQHLILDGDALTIVTASAVVKVDKMFVCYGIPTTEKPHPDFEYLKRNQENLLMALGLCLG